MQRVQLSVRKLRAALQRSPLCDLAAGSDRQSKDEEDDEPTSQEAPGRGVRMPLLPPLPKEAPPVLPPLPPPPRPQPDSPPLDENDNKPKGGAPWDDDMGLESLGDALNREKELIARWDMADLVVLSDLKDDSPPRQPPATPEPPSWPRSGSRSAKESATSASACSGSRGSKRSRSRSPSKRCSRSRKRSRSPARSRRRSRSSSPGRSRRRSPTPVPTPIRRRSRSRSRRRSPLSSDSRRGKRRHRRSSSSSRSPSRSWSRSRSRSPSCSRGGAGRSRSCWRGARGRGRARRRSSDSRGRRSRSRSTCIVSRSVVDLKRGRGTGLQGPPARRGRGDLHRAALAPSRPSPSRSPPPMFPSLPTSRASSTEAEGFTMHNGADAVEEFNLQDRMVTGSWRKNGRRPQPCKMCINHGLLRMFVGSHRAHCAYITCACELCMASRRRLGSGDSNGKPPMCTMCLNHGEEVLFSQDHKFRCKHFKCMCRLCRGVRTRFKAAMQNKTLCVLCERHLVFNFDDSVHDKVCRFRGCRCHLCQRPSPSRHLVASYGSDGDSRDSLEDPRCRKDRPASPSEEEPPPPGVDEEPHPLPIPPVVVLPGMDKYRDVTPSPGMDPEQDLAPPQVDETNKVASVAGNPEESVRSEATPPSKTAVVTVGEGNHSAERTFGSEETVDAISEFLRNSDSGPLSPSPTSTAVRMEDSDDTIENIDLEALLDDLSEEAEEVTSMEHTEVPLEASPGVSRLQSETTPQHTTSLKTTPLSSGLQRSSEPVLDTDNLCESTPSSEVNFRLQLTPSTEERQSRTDSPHQSLSASSNLVVYESEASLDEDDELDLDDTLSDRLVIDLDDAASDRPVTPVPSDLGETPVPLDEDARASPGRRSPRMSPAKTISALPTTDAAEVKTEKGAASKTNSTAQASPSNKQERYCAFCRNHGKLQTLKGHKTSCEYRLTCKCLLCAKRAAHNQQASGQPSPRGRGRPRGRGGFLGIPRVADCTPGALQRRNSHDSNSQVQDYRLKPVFVRLDESSLKSKEAEDIPLNVRLQHQKIEKLGIKPLGDHLEVKTTKLMKLEDMPLYARLKEFKMMSKDNMPLFSRLSNRKIKKKKIKLSPSVKCEEEVLPLPLGGMSPVHLAEKTNFEGQSLAFDKGIKVMSGQHTKDNKFKNSNLNETKLSSMKVDKTIDSKPNYAKISSGPKETYQVITELHDSVIGKVTVRNEAEMLASPKDFLKPNKLKVPNSPNVLLHKLKLEHQAESLGQDPAPLHIVQTSPQAIFQKPQATLRTPTSPMDLSVPRRSQETLKSPEVTVTSVPGAPLKLKFKLMDALSSASLPLSTEASSPAAAPAPPAHPACDAPQLLVRCVSVSTANVPCASPQAASSPQASLLATSSVPQATVLTSASAPQVSVLATASAPQTFLSTSVSTPEAFVPSSASAPLVNGPPDRGHQSFMPLSAPVQLFSATPPAKVFSKTGPKSFTPSVSAPPAYCPPASAPPAYCPPASAPLAYCPSASAPPAYCPSASAPPAAYCPSASAPPAAYCPSASAPPAYGPSTCDSQALGPSTTAPQAYMSANAPSGYYPSPSAQTSQPSARSFPGRTAAAASSPCFDPVSCISQRSACPAESVLPELGVDLEDELGVGDSTPNPAGKPVLSTLSKIVSLTSPRWKLPGEPVLQSTPRLPPRGSVTIRGLRPITPLDRMVASWGSSATVPSIPASRVAAAGPSAPAGLSASAAAAAPATHKPPPAPTYAPARPWESAAGPGASWCKTYPCSDCGLKQTSAVGQARHSVENHMASNKQSCDKCSAVSWSQLQSDVHGALAHPPDVQHRCPTCAACFPSDVMLTTHLQTSKDALHIASRGSLPAEQADLTCPICWTFRAQTAKQLGKHVRSQHANSHPFACDEPGCSLAFDTPLELQKHRQRHVQENTQERCLACCVPFVTRDLLNDHWRQKHPGPTPFACPLCPKAFRAPLGLTHHVRRQHPGTTPFRCREEGCNRSFLCVAVLHEHACESRHMSLPPPTSLFTQPKLWQPQLQLDPTCSGSTSTTNTASTCAVCPASLPDEWSLMDHQDADHMNLVPIARVGQLLSLVKDANVLRAQECSTYAPYAPGSVSSPLNIAYPASYCQSNMQSQLPPPSLHPPQPQQQLLPPSLHPPQPQRQLLPPSLHPPQPQRQLLPPSLDPPQPQFPLPYPSQSQLQLPTFTHRPVFSQPQSFAQSTSYVQTTTTTTFVPPSLYSEFKQT